MSKFNQNTTGSQKTTNLAGGHAYKMEDKVKLVTQVLTSFFGEKKYYGDNTNELIATARKVMETDAEFVAKLAVYAREVFYLRSVSQALATELANNEKGKPFAKSAIERVSQRADDMTEILAYQLGVFGKPIPNSLKKGLANSFKKFDEYQLAKYNRTGKATTLKDILLLARPKPANDEQASLWKRVLENNLEVPVTWETQLSARGNTKEVWEELIAGNHVGYMALLRNLRNIFNSGASNTDQVLAKLRDPEQVRRSKQLPFRFLSAYKVAERELNSSKVLDTLSDALDVSIENMPRLEGKTFFTHDTSGSMDSPLSKNSSVTYNDVGALMMAMAHQMCDDSITSVFGTEFAVVNASTRSSVLENMRKFQNTNVGWSTNLHKAIEWLVNSKTVVDRIVVFSDMQAYNYDRATQSLVDRYRREVNPNVWVHSFDLAGYGTQQFQGNRVNLVAGWSEKSLEFMSLAEKGMETLVQTIENYAL